MLGVKFETFVLLQSEGHCTITLRKQKKEIQLVIMYNVNNLIYVNEESKKKKNISTESQIWDKVKTYNIKSSISWN